MADGDGFAGILRGHKGRTGGPGDGTWSVGPSVVQPGFQGFGLGFHLGYGYGGDALGVGPDGGYPVYGGPGYPHAEPCLRRLAGIVPFPYFGGPGYPSPDHPNYFGGVGPLIHDQPVVRLGGERGDASDRNGFGVFTGGPPDAESRFSSFTSAAAVAGASGGVNSPYPASTPRMPVPASGSRPNSLP